MFIYFVSLILIFPFLASLTTGLLSNLLGKTGAINVSLFYIGLNVIIILLALHNTLFIRPDITYSVNFGEWINSELICVEWEFFFDRFNICMLFVVNFVSFWVHIYSLKYMENDPHLLRFMSYISIFTFFMVILVTGNNFLILFMGWEGVGLCSYLLINFWFTRVNANKSAMKALIVNRVGDFGLTLGLIMIFNIFKSLDFSVVFALSPYLLLNTTHFFGIELYIGTIIGSLLFVGAVGKSAQIGLHTWLPDAMEGPTPVSALIHAATMVTAGVFLIIKCSPLYEYIPSVLSGMVLIGALTSFFAASVALVQNDIKKVIAYSTCSQLGYMIFACGLSSYHVSFFHLTNHAFFKALLFLTAGAVIHSLSNDQDMRKYGAVSFLLPLSAVTITIGSLALAGTPFLSGFYSKDAILELSFAYYTIDASFAYILGLITAVLTSLYSYRVFFLTFISTAQLYRKNIEKIHESPFYMGLSLITLGVCSIYTGYFLKDIFIGLGNDFWQNAIFIHPQNNHQIDSEFIPQIYKLLPFLGSLLFITLVNLIWHKNIFVFQSLFFNKVFKFLTYKWYFDTVYNSYIGNKILNISYNVIFKTIDKGILEIFGPTGIYLTTSKLSFNIKSKLIGQVVNISFFYIFGLFGFLAIIYWFL